MSSLAATQADGYYLPPEYYESGAYKKQGKNGWYQKQQKQKQGHKDDNNKSSSPQQQVQVVRFELVDPCECLGCQHRIGKGTRFNATKVRIGSYLDQQDCPIFEFRCKCRICGHAFAIQTDPAQRGFAYTAGIRRQERSWNEEESSGDVVVNNNNDSGGLQDTIRKHQQQKQQRKTELEELQELQTLNRLAYQHDADQNAKIRKNFRRDREERQQKLANVKARGWWKSGAQFRDDDDDDDDIDVMRRVAAAEQTFGPSVTEQQKQQWVKVRTSSIFQRAVTSKGCGSASRKQEQQHCQGRLQQNGTTFTTAVQPDAVPSLSLLPAPKRKRQKACAAAVETVDLTTTTTTTTRAIKDELSMSRDKNKPLKRRIVLPTLGGLGSAPTSSSALTADVTDTNSNKHDKNASPVTTTENSFLGLLASYASSSSDGDEKEEEEG